MGVGRRLRLRATRQTVGRYECRAEADGFPEVSRELMLFVRARPEVTARPTQHGAPGETVHVECVGTSVPAPQVAWYFQQAPVPRGEYWRAREFGERRGRREGDAGSGEDGSEKGETEKIQMRHFVRVR